MSRYVIDKTALIENVHYLQKKAGVPIIGVVKGNGYGFGLTELALILEHCGITTLAVTEVTDIAPLRAVLQPNTDILVMRSTCVDSEARHIADTGCIATIGSTRAAQAMQAAAADLGVKVPCHLKIDTGMGRYGFLPAQVAEAIACYDLPNLEFTGAYTHFSSAFHDKAKTIAQLEVFKDTLAQIEKAGKTVGTRHAANSPALLNVEHVALDAVRIGSAFTGRVITHSETPLHRLGRLEAEVVDMKEVPAGYAVGYNGTFVTKRPTTIAIVPMGHYDGFGLTKEKEDHNFHSVLSALKQFLKKAHLTVTINGKAYPVIGEVGLSHTAVDVTGSSVQPGDIATCDLSPLLVNPRVPRIYNAKSDLYLTNTSRFLLLKHAAQALLDLTGIQQFRHTQQPLVKKEQQIHRQPKAHQKPLVTAHRVHGNGKHIHQQQIHCRQCRIKQQALGSQRHRPRPQPPDPLAHDGIIAEKEHIHQHTLLVRHQKEAEQPRRHIGDPCCAVAEGAHQHHHQYPGEHGAYVGQHRHHTAEKQQQHAQRRTNTAHGDLSRRAHTPHLPFRLYSL